MSDLYIADTLDGGEIVLDGGGSPKTSSSLWNAVYFSLFTPKWWGNATEDAESRFNSKIPSLTSATLTNQARLNIEAEAANALSWLTEAGIAQAVDVEATIPEPDRINLVVRVTKPGGVRVDFAYARNWDATGRQ